MSTSIKTEDRWYRGSRSPYYNCVGYDGWPLVGRFKFHTPSTGATSLSFASESYQIYGGEYQNHDPGFRFLITDQSTGYEQKTGGGIGQSAVKQGYALTGSSGVELLPDADYYLWIWPNSTLFSRISIGKVWVTLAGIYGTPSVIQVSDGNFGGQIPVSLTPSGPGALHSLTVSCAGRTETLLTGSSAVSCVWTPDLETYAALLPNSGSAQAVFSCETRYGENDVGGSTAAITLRFPAGSLAPELSAGWAQAAVYNTGPAAGIPLYIQGYSRAEVSFDSTKIRFKNGAGAAGFRIRCAGVTVSAAPYRTEVLTGDAEILCTVTDSRGQEASAALQLSVEPYAEPRLTEAAVFRCDSGGTAADDGQYYSAGALALFAALGGYNSIALTAAHKQSEAAAYGSETALQNGTASVIGTISPDSSYRIRLQATDRLGNSALLTVELPTQRWAMKFRPNGLGVGFGKAPEHDNCIELPAGWVIRIGERVIDGS